ncbi:hypothetical protein KY385_03365 [Candidatus Parcubacteria bacterium]|nr:hypothetical protein [Candidatus Parcubacteria bacterium]
MNSLRRLQGGYTITEVMIFLIVSSALFIAAVTGFGQQNTRNQFNLAVRDLEVKIQDVLNDVSTGYYPNGGNFSCRKQSNKPFISNVWEGQGKNQDCIFIGRAVDMDLAINDTTYETYTIVGLRNDPNTGKPANSVTSAVNRAIFDTDDTRSVIDSAVESNTIHGSIRIAKIVVGNGNIIGASSVKGFAVYTGFGGSKVSGSGATTNQVSIASITKNSSSYTNGNSSVIDTPNLADKVLTICIEESGGGSAARHATITIGKGSSLVDVDTKIGNKCK